MSRKNNQKHVPCEKIKIIKIEISANYPTNSHKYALKQYKAGHYNG